MAYVNSDDTLLPGAVTRRWSPRSRPIRDLVMVYGDALYTDADPNETG